MKALVFVLPLALVTGVFGQAVHRSFGSVVFPGGTSATSPSITRGSGSAVFPGGTATHGGTAVTGGGSQGPGHNSNFRRNPTYGRGSTYMPSYIYAYPMFIGGGYYDNSYAPNSYAPQEVVPPQQPNVVVVYPGQQQQATPVMIQAGPDGSYTTTGQRQISTIYEPPPDGPDQAAPASDVLRYLLAFRDHTIYSAVAYWVDGETLHYFTSGNVHNQASMSLLDRELTERLNREMGIDFKLPAPK